MSGLRSDTYYEQFVDAARGLLKARTAEVALAEVGLDELLESAAGSAEEAAAFAFADAQGYVGARTTAVSRIALTSVLRAAGWNDGIDPVLGLPVAAGEGRSRTALLGASDRSQVFVDAPGRGLLAVARPSSGKPQHFGDDYLTLIDVELTGADVVLDERAFAPLREGMVSRLRLAASAEIMGAASRLIDDAVRHCASRRQFGAPLSSFPPVRDVLAWAATDWKELSELLAVEWRRTPLNAPAADLAETAKALAGSCGMRIAQATLQATGAIGFTWEYPHAQLHRRILALDAVAGTSAELTRAIGRRLVSTGQISRLFDLGATARQSG